jgi:hypothetical protein
MAMNPLPGLSPAASDLGLGGQLRDQVVGETEEQRKKRLLEMQQRQMLGPSGSLAVGSLFGSGLGAGTSY